MDILRTLFDICLLRGRPQDLPTSSALVMYAAGIGVVIDTFSMPGQGFEFRHLVFAILQTGLFGGLLWVVLKWRGHAARWIQTATALYAINALFSLLVLPLTPALHEMGGPDGQPVFGWEILLAFLLSVWFLAVMARVLREALEVSLLASVGASLALMISVFVIGTILAAMLGLYASS